MGFPILARNSLCSVMICCSSWFRLGFWCLSPFLRILSFPGKGFCFIMMCWFLLVPARVVVLVSLSSLFCLCSGKGFCFIMMSWLFVVPALVPVLVSLLLSSFLPQEMEFVPSWSWFLLVPARVPVLVSLLLSSCFSQ